MAKKTPEEIAALQKAAAEKKEAARLEAQKKAAEKKESDRLASEQKAADKKASDETNALQQQNESKNVLKNISNVATKEKVPALWIRSVPESFMRCGRRFTREAYGIALDLLSDEEIERLKAEPNLVVEEVEAILD